jgi:MFS family permease
VPALRPLLLLACSVVLVDTMFYAAITPLLPTYVDDFSLSKGGAGVLAGAYAAGTLLGALPGGWLASRWGVKPTVLLGMGSLAVSSVAFAFAPGVELLVAARFVQGFGGAASWAGALAWLVGASPRERRGELIGTALGAAIVGGLLGPVLGGLADVTTPEATFSGVAVLAAGLAVWAWRTPAARPEAATPLAAVPRALRDGRVAGGMWLIAMPGLMFGTISVLVPLRLDELGASAAGVAAVWLVAAGLEAIVSPLVGRLSDRRGRLGPVMVALAGASVLLLLFPVPDRLAVVVALMLVAAPVIGILWAPASALLSDGAEGVGLDQGYAFALLNLGWATGQTVGSAGGGGLAGATSDAVPFVILSLVCLATLAVLVRTRPAAAPAGDGYAPGQWPAP